MAPDSANGWNSVRRWVYASILLFTVSFLMIAIFGAYAVIRGQQVNQELCHVANDNRTLLVNMLKVARKQALEDATDLIDRSVIRERYDELRALIPPLKCTTQGGPIELEP